jgi:Domain of unknown function (DUF4190)/Domain of unknown function (DUF1707)
MTTEYGQAPESQYGRPAAYAQTGYGHLRASDQDRERATSVLQAAYAQGRLTQQEYDDRLGLVLTAQVHSQLDALVVDLVPPPARQGTNALAVASLACGAGQVFAGPLSGIPAIVFGHMARRQIRQTGEDGASLATAGLALGYVGVGLAVLAAVIFAAVVAGILSQL